jgi:hypothetical protein
MSWFTSKQYAGICLKKLRKIAKNLSQNIRFQTRDLNLGPSEYEVVMITNLAIYSIAYQ